MKLHTAFLNHIFHTADTKINGTFHINWIT